MCTDQLVIDFGDRLQREPEVRAGGGMFDEKRRRPAHAGDPSIDGRVKPAL